MFFLCPLPLKDDDIVAAELTKLLAYEEHLVFKSNGKGLVIQQENEKETIVEGNQKLSKNDGAHKLYHHICKRWCGISRPFVQGTINKNQHVQQNRPRFDN